MMIKKINTNLPLLALVISEVKHRLECCRVHVFVSLWEASASSRCTPDWTAWLPDSIRLDEIKAHEGAVKLVKKKKSSRLLFHLPVSPHNAQITAVSVAQCR